MQYKTNTISILYELKFRFKPCNYIQFTSDLKQVFNYHSGNEITTSNNSRKGFWHKRKFHQLRNVKTQIELIPKYQYNFNDPLINLK